MSQSSSRSRKRDYASTSRSSAIGKTKSTTLYSGEFEQKLIDRGVYPKGYRTAEGLRAPKPNNMSEMCNVLGNSSSSLSPSLFTEAMFEEFQENNERASSESKAIADVIPAITGSKDRTFHSAADIAFRRLERFDPDVSVPNPDRYYRARPAQIDVRVRRDLNEYIVLSNRTSLLVAPNLFFEGKSASRRLDVA